MMSLLSTVTSVNSAVPKAAFVRKAMPAPPPAWFWVSIWLSNTRTSEKSGVPLSTKMPPPSASPFPSSSPPVIASCDRIVPVGAPEATWMTRGLLRSFSTKRS